MNHHHNRIAEIVDTIMVDIDRVYTYHRNRRIMQKFACGLCGSRQWRANNPTGEHWHCIGCGQFYDLIAGSGYAYISIYRSDARFPYTEKGALRILKG